MLDLKDFSFMENQTMFDFKGFFLKVAGYWKWILGCILLFLFVAYQINIRKEKIYALDALIVVRDEASPLLTSNTSLIFNWGGVSEKVQTITAILKSRHHNEQVVEQLEYYIDYLIKDKYNYVDAYGRVPFYVDIDKSKPQLANHYIGIKFLNESEYELTVIFEEEQARTYTYSLDLASNINVEKATFSKKYKIGEHVSLPFLNWKLELKDNFFDYKGKEYFVSFNSFNSTVSKYSQISVSNANKTGGSILKLELEGTNKNKLVEYLNTTVNILRENQLESKNQFAVNTIRFIDSTLAKMQNENSKTSDAMKDFMRDKDVYVLSGEGEKLLMSRLTQYDIEKETILRKIQYYKSLEQYLNKSTDYSELPAPTVAGIEDSNIYENVSKLVELSVQRSKTTFGIKNENTFKQFDSEMESRKLVLLENISSAKAALEYDLDLVNSKIGGVESSIKKLPFEKQDQMEIARKYNLEQEFLGIFLSKRSEAEIMKAANQSDVHFIDTAKDVGKGLVGPKTGINYVLAIFLGILLPVLVLLVTSLLDSSVRNSEDVARLSKVPVIGVLPKKRGDSNLEVYEHSKSALAESFRAVRSSLQFLYKKKNITGSKTVMITSSVSGEGKTFCSINLATVFALSEKKTVVVGLDLRKPKISNDFKISKDIGCVNYLIGQKSLDEIIQPTDIPYLDVIVAGPVPPNPSELIMSENMATMLEELQQRYDYIILDTPPIGLVSDAMELAPYCDAVL
ncbi:MAG: polysaccharide biosynthesis tyrosine autokinase, partial [Flavobacteriaceae bacterium]